MEPDLSLLKEIASHILAEVKPLAGTPKAGKVVGKGAGGDTTKLIDQVAEKVVFAELEQNSIDCTVVSEEYGTKKIGDEHRAKETYIIVDSIDGTNNALRGIPFYALSIAAAKGLDLSSIHTALVTDITQGISYWAVKGNGAASDLAPLRTSNLSNLQEALVGIDLSAIRDEAALKRLAGLILNTSHTRHFGANALELCYLAAGKLDAFVDLRNRLRITDVAAAYLIVREAGGLIVDTGGRVLNTPIIDPTQRVSFIASANRQLLEQILKLLRM